MIENPIGSWSVNLREFACVLIELRTDRVWRLRISNRVLRPISIPFSWRVWSGQGGMTCANSLIRRGIEGGATGNKTLKVRNLSDDWVAREGCAHSTIEGVAIGGREAPGIKVWWSGAKECQDPLRMLARLPRCGAHGYRP